MLLSHGLHHVSWCRFRLQAGFSTVSVTSLLEATGFLRNRDSKNAILSFFLLLGSDSVLHPKRRARMERCIMGAVTWYRFL